MMPHVCMASLYVACCVSRLEILDMTHCHVHAFLCISRKGTFLTLIVYVPWLSRLVAKTVSGGLFGLQRINREMAVSRLHGESNEI